jgi:hypothetical protein
MSPPRTFKIGLVVVLFALSVAGSPSRPTAKFDDYGDVNCEVEWARLDNFAIGLSQSPAATGYIVFYGGRRFRGRLPKRGEAAARAARIQPYLVERRGVAAHRIIVINGGYSESFHVELWIVPPGAIPPEPISTVSEKEIRFARGRARKQMFQCNL